ncbi:hypothetical protein C7441_12138 [Pseudaminobacter salicylatoxidans]|uniref:Uncharacterized protein n=1 Tax=Pseudaminobacter salicylatoxidans TaxID=93369 RepID=A0A316BTU7_PSESE|nr:hypothetical protein [Pseudaminobacter salicylatoxidans]PWJ75256.1 hypothetical protein C7441_12138 [Pseudaminobacter salicylatoxidans]
MSTDAKLVELGRQFEHAKAEARALQAERKRTYRLYIEAANEKNVPLADVKTRNHIARQCGYQAAYRAFEERHKEAIRLMRAIDREQATTLPGFAVKLAAVAFDQFDFDLEPTASYAAEKKLLRLSKEISKAAGRELRQGGAA